MQVLFVNMENMAQRKWHTQYDSQTHWNERRVKIWGEY